MEKQSELRELTPQEIDAVSGGGRHGLNVTSGGANTNKALGFGSQASQTVFTGAQ